MYMSKIRLSFAIGCVIATMSVIGCKPKAEIGLKDAFADKFYFGTAMDTQQITGEDSAAVRVIKQHFNSIVAENIMKSEIIQPVEGEFDFSLADQFVKFGTDNKMHIIGHTLIWHSQAPKWFFVDKQGNDVSAEVLTERMRTHIHTVVKRYKGRVHGWDVVNEAILDDGSWRKSKFYEILGEDFVKLAFQFAREADPNAELYYNDYSMAHEAKRNGVIAMVKNLQAQGIKVDGIGMQGHLTFDFPTVDAFEKSLVAFAETGVKVMITELDLSALPSPWANVGANISDAVAYEATMNPFVEGIPMDAYSKWEAHYMDFFNLFVKHSDKISRVTLWGVNDTQSWKNDFPVRGRTDYPLLFDRQFEPKPIVDKLLNMTKAQ
jgi:endo-1,4-beta-xylanase